LNTIKRLFDSIPNSDKIEVLLVDNSFKPITKECVDVDKDYTLLWASPERYAGGARNEGIIHAHGKWLVFADADDYFEDNAFDVFYNYFDSEADIIYFCANSIYADTGETATRSDGHTNNVLNYIYGQHNEWNLRLGISVPWAKMIKRDFIINNNIKFDEVIASNDSYFSLLSGYYAKKIEASDRRVYVVTVTRGSLTNRRDILVLESRLRVTLRKNLFLRRHGLHNYQQSVMLFLKQSLSYGLLNFIKFIVLVVRYGQNPFIGWKNWRSTIKRHNMQEKKDANYIIKSS